MKTLRNISFLLTMAAALFNTACTEKIDLKLKNSPPSIVIEGNISDRSGPYYVVVSKSKRYYEDNNFEGIAGATVVVNDDAGNTDTLTAILPGLYQTNTMQGTVGRTYTLTVTAEGTTYTTSCKMHPPVVIDSLDIFEETDFQGNKQLDGRAIVRDPVGLGNSYRVVSIINGEQKKGIAVHTDRLWDGKTRNFGIPSDGFASGDTILVQLWSIDEKIYTYFYEFDQNQNNFGQPAAPSNPTTVFTPAALGYFSAHSITDKQTIVP